MKVELLHIDECPNWEQTGSRLRTALDSVGRTDDAINYILLRTTDEAAKYPFAGSPTILLDGKDPFSNGGTITELACRVYQTENGLAGSPTTQQLIQLLKEHN